MNSHLEEFITAVNNAQLLWAEALRLGHVCGIGGEVYEEEWPAYTVVKSCLQSAKDIAKAAYKP